MKPNQVLTQQQLAVRASTTPGESAVARAMREAADAVRNPAPAPPPSVSAEPEWLKRLRRIRAIQERRTAA